MHLKNKDGLLVPISYLVASEEEKKKVINKCGPDGFLNRLVPNHLLGAEISIPCNYHDWTFAKSKTLEEHKKSDQLFLENMQVTIEKKSGSGLKKVLRHIMAYVYYGAVRVYSTLKYSEMKK